jgi:hypothetical protein
MINHIQIFRSKYSKSVFQISLVLILSIIWTTSFGGNNLVSAPENPGYPKQAGARMQKSSQMIQLLDVSMLNLKPANVQTLQNSLAHTNTSITLEQTDFQTITTPGNSWIEYLNNDDTILMNIGMANSSSPQSWTFPAELMTKFKSFYRTDFISPSSVPIPLRLSGANMVAKNYCLDFDGVPIDVFYQYNISATEVTSLGTSYDLENGDDDVFDEPNFEYADVPLDIGDVVSSIEYPENSTSNQNLLRITETKTVDAYGTIATPDGTFNCLRVSSTTEYATRPNETSAFTVVSTFNGIEFVTKEGYYFTATVGAMNGQNRNLTNFTYRKIVKTNLLTEIADVKMNNDSKGVSINTDNTTAHASAILEVKSDSLGILIPRIAKANRPHTPATGLLVYQIDNTPGFYYFDGTAWRILSSSASARIAAEESSETGSDQLEKGSKFIRFENPQNNPENVVIQIQPEGDCNGIFISQKTKEGFWVKELQKGKSNVKFSYTINQK